MSRIDSICNRNIKIIATYLINKLGHYDTLFDEIPYPSDRYASPDEFFLNEDEWTTFDNFKIIFRKAREMSKEDYFYFNCGASVIHFQSWGRFENLIKIFMCPNDFFRKLPFFNKNFSDTKEFEIVIPPGYDKKLKTWRTVIKVLYHDDIDVQFDYISDPYRRGMVSALPTIWGLEPAQIKQPLNPFDPEILFNIEPEFSKYKLNARMSGAFLFINDPATGKKKAVGKKVLIKPELINGKKVFLGKYSEIFTGNSNRTDDKKEAILITDTITIEDRIILKAGEIFKSPYFIMDISYNRGSFVNRMIQSLKINRNHDSSTGLIDNINQLRRAVGDKNEAYNQLEKTNHKLIKAQKDLEKYNQTLEQKVIERTAELSKAKENLEILSSNLKKQVIEKADEIQRYRNLRRYLSAKLTDKILSSGDGLIKEPQRKMMTVLFSDIRGFSQLTDNLEPEELFHLLDMYISEMTKIIHKYDGTLNKIIGDGILVFFGDPVPMKDHAKNAVLMAIDMQETVDNLKPEWLRYGYELQIGIGINTGYMTVGNIGSDMHMDYTVIGNQVNVAARLESEATAGQILVSQRTHSRIRDLIRAEEMGKIKVKGIHSPINTFNILGLN